MLDSDPSLQLNKQKQLTRDFVDLDQSSSVLELSNFSLSYSKWIKQEYQCRVRKETAQSWINQDSSSDIQQAHFIAMWGFSGNSQEFEQALLLCRNALPNNGVLLVDVFRQDSANGHFLQNNKLDARRYLVISKKDFIEIAERLRYDIVDYLPYGTFPDELIFFQKWFGALNSKTFFTIFRMLSSPIFKLRAYLNLSSQTLVVRKLED